MRERVLLLMPTSSYKATAFMEAADRLGVELVVGTDRRQALERTAPGHTLAFDLRHPSESVVEIADAHERQPFRAVIGTDDETTILAALAGEALGLPHNPEHAARAARDKHAMRSRFAASGLRGPAFRAIGLDRAPGAAAGEVGYPCVLKPLTLSGSRGVLRADDPEQFVAAFRRIAAILQGSRRAQTDGRADALLIEDYLPGAEVAVEALLDGGRLRPLAVFDKPDPLCGPTFEETLFVTPSRLPEAIRTAVVDEVAAGCRALGLCEGPVHAELRVHDGRAWLLEIAPRTIGGRCSRALRFGTSVSLEELILRHAVGRKTADLRRERRAGGVMMIPIPRAGVLREVAGIEQAAAVPGVESVEIVLPRGSKLIPLPEGHRYLGFIFARDAEPAGVERALREAHARLRFGIDPPAG